MRRFFNALQTTLKTKDSWMFLAVFLVLSTERAINVEPRNWKVYLTCFLLLSMLYLPLLVFVHFKTKVKQKSKRPVYRLSLFLAYIGYPALVIPIAQGLPKTSLQYVGSVEYFFGMGITVAALGILLELNEQWSHQHKVMNWVKKIGIDRAILLTMLFFSVTFSLMAVSNLETFREKELILPSINLRAVFANFFLFVGFTLQFMALYVSLYFFYLLNDKVLIPTLLKERGIIAYIIGMGGSIALFFPLLGQLLMLLPLMQSTPSILLQNELDLFTEQNASVPLVILICTLPILITIKWYRQNHQISQLEKQQMESELSLLKQQINPHFFFNTLNNLYSLSLIKSDKSPEVILQLSELMRYTIYKGKEKAVMVEEEVAYLEDYIQLQQIRLHKEFELTFEKGIKENALHIPPLLLIILVENAFKHGIEPAQNKCFLNMQLISDNRKLTFSCTNSFEENKQKVSGIGLENLRRRLELLYPNRHDLIIEKEGGIFKAQLSLWNT